MINLPERHDDLGVNDGLLQQFLFNSEEQDREFLNLNENFKVLLMTFS